MKRSTFGIAMRMLFAKKQRLILTCIGIAVSFGLIIVISTLYVSMERSVQKTIVKEVGAFDLVVGYNPWKSKNSKKLLTKEEISKLRNMDGVIDSGVAIAFPELATNQYDSAARQKDDINYSAVEPNELIRKFYGFTTTLQPDEMVITEEVARRWGVKQGDTKEFSMSNDIVLKKVVGEIIPNYTSGPAAVIVHIDAIRQEYSLGEVANTVYLDIADGISDKAVEAAIRSEFDENMNIALHSQTKTVIKQRTMFRFIAIGLGGILLLVSILFLSSSFKLMLLGRVRELSTFRMIGASRRVIYKMVMMEAAVLNLLGVVLGVGVGVLFCNLSAKFIDSMMGIAVNNVEMDWPIVVTIAVLGWLLLTLSVMRIAVTAAASAPLVAVRFSEQERLNRSHAWVAGSLFVIGCVILCLAWLDLISTSTRLLFTLMGGLLAAGGCILGTGYMIPIVSRISGWFISKFAIAEAYYAMKQFVALRRQNSFIVMLLASIVTAFIAIPTFIDNLNRVNTEQVINKHVTPIVIGTNRDVMSSKVLEQVRQVEGVDQALPIGSFQSVLLADIDYERVDPKWLKRNSYHPEYLKGTPLYETYEYEWIGAAKTDFKLMQQMGLIKQEHNELSSGIVIQSEYAAHMGIALGDTVSLQRTSLGKKLEKYELPVSGVTDLSFITHETLALVDHNNPKVSWIEGDNNGKSNVISPQTIYVQVSEGADIASVRIALQQLLEDDPSIKVTDLDSEILRIAEQSREQYTILWAVMAIFVVVGIVGVINTLGATFHAHRREYAILRAIRLTTAGLRSVMIVQGLLYAITAIVVGILASGWIIVGLFSGTDELNGWTINWFTIALPIIIVGVISLLISFLYAKQIGLNSITEELSVE